MSSSRQAGSGVITRSGYEAALDDLDQQGYSVKSKLNEIGQGKISEGRSSLQEIINQAREDASNADLGDGYDAYSYSSKADEEFNTWLAGLSDSIRGTAGSDLFSTGSLASVAGTASGAQNTKFNANALAGVMEDEEEDDEEEDTTSESIF
jgi:hypothetical protein